jgi:hypothetical protein
MKAHWDSLCGCDFFAVEALGLTGTVRYMVFFAIVVKIRAVEIAGIATHPDGKWMQQMARNLTDSVDGFLRNATYLIHDRDPLSTEAFEAILAERGVKCVRIPARSPNCNPCAWMMSSSTAVVATARHRPSARARQDEESGLARRDVAHGEIRHNGRSTHRDDGIPAGGDVFTCQSFRCMK